MTLTTSTTMTVWPRTKTLTRSPCAALVPLATIAPGSECCPSPGLHQGPALPGALGANGMTTGIRPLLQWLTGLCLPLQSMDSSDLSDGAVTLQEYLELKKALATSEAKVQQLLKVNSSLSDELRRLQREVRAAALVGVGAPRAPVGGAAWTLWNLTPLHTLRSTSYRQKTCKSGSHQGQCLCPHLPSLVTGQNMHPWGLEGVPTAGIAKPSPCMSQALP